jgi:hypothetical protein
MTARAAALGWLLSGCALALLASCSRTSQPLPAAALASTPAAAPLACSGLPVQIADLAGILNDPVTRAKPISGDSQSCEFSGGGFPSITISVRPGVGQGIVAAWLAGKMPLKAAPLAGVGDAAAWQSSLQEVIAQKHNLLCNIEVRGGAGDIAVAPTELPAALGALCNRIFAAG